MPSERWVPGKHKAVTTQVDAANQVARLHKVLAGQRKVELIEALVELAAGDRKILRRLESLFDVKAPMDQLVVATRQAIVDATAFDERRINCNFNYDHQAYETVERNFRQLVKDGCLDQAMDLSLELMRQGSYQVEMSDEGLMTEEINACLEVVIGALEMAKLSAARVLDWYDRMKRADAIGFIAEKSLKALRDQYLK